MPKERLNEDNEILKIKISFLSHNCFAIGLTLLVFSLYFAFGVKLYQHFMLTLSYSFIFFLGYFLLKKTNIRFKKMIHWYNLTVLSIVGFAFAISGGLSAPAIFWIPVICYTTAVLGNKRLMLTWMGLSFLFVSIAFFIQSNFNIFTQLQNEALRPGLHYVHYILLSLYTLFINLTQSSIQEKYTEKQYQFIEKSYHENRLASLGEMIAGIGHEINNPLTITIGNHSLVEKMVLSSKTPNPKIIKALKTQKDAHTRIMNIVQTLRNFSRSGKNSKQEVNMIELIENTLQIFTQSFSQEKIELNAELPAKKVLVKGDPVKIQQIIINLLSNAKDSLSNSSNKNISIRLTTKTNKTILEIQDTGPGVPKEIQDKIFDPFFTSKPLNKGTGLGLSIVNHIIREMDGEIKLASPKEGGALFRITLPNA